MSRFVGITTDPFHLTRSLKREALLFDEIAAQKTDLVLHLMSSEQRGELELLEENGILSFVPDHFTDAAIHALAGRGMLDLRLLTPTHGGLIREGPRLYRIIENIEGKTRDERIKSFLNSPTLLHGWLLYHSNLSRAIRIYFQQQLDHDAVLIFSPLNGLPTAKATAAARDGVARIILRQLPQPNDSTPWEAIIDFRRDSEARGKFLGLKKWMNDVTRTDASTAEKEDQLAWLLHEYEQHLQMHRIKYRRSIFESLVIASAGIIENTLKLRFSEAAKALFSLRHRSGILLEAEKTAPGRELAYIAHARSRFPK